jgi:hypothetical protein
MMRPCYSAILNHAAGGKPAIVFVPTRKHVRLTALDLLTSAAADGAQHRWAATAQGVAYVLQALCSKSAAWYLCSRLVLVFSSGLGTAPELQCMHHLWGFALRLCTAAL